jgi:hypothetical protein
MGPSSAFGGAFGGSPPTFGGPVGVRNINPTAPAPVINKPIGGPAGPGQQGGPLPGPGPVQIGGQTTGQPGTPPPAPGQLGPQAVRASGPSQGYDPSYMQNLATAIGGLFSNPGGGNTMKINPLGTLGEISGPSGQEGNAPQQGLPQNWLQQALNGLGFSFGTPTPTSVVPTAPNAGSANGNGGGNGSGNGRARTALQ